MIQEKNEFFIIYLQKFYFCLKWTSLKTAMQKMEVSFVFMKSI